eukprot:751176-Hanusia_phi.AAC.3
MLAELLPGLVATSLLTASWSSKTVRRLIELEIVFTLNGADTSHEDKESVEGPSMEMQESDVAILMTENRILKKKMASFEEQHNLMMKALDREYTSQISKRATEQRVMRKELDEILYQMKIDKIKYKEELQKARARSMRDLPFEDHFTPFQDQGRNEECGHSQARQAEGGGAERQTGREISQIAHLRHENSQLSGGVVLGAAGSRDGHVAAGAQGSLKYSCESELQEEEGERGGGKTRPLLVREKISGLTMRIEEET